jgi:hypothetical protein
MNYGAYFEKRAIFPGFTQYIIGTIGTFNKAVIYCSVQYFLGFYVLFARS